VQLGTRIEIPELLGVSVSWFFVAVEKPVQHVQDLRISLQSGRVLFPDYLSHALRLRLYSVYEIQLTPSSSPVLLKLDTTYRILR